MGKKFIPRTGTRPVVLRMRIPNVGMAHFDSCSLVLEGRLQLTALPLQLQENDGVLNPNPMTAIS